MSQRGQSAVVCGASMSGLLAARVLSDFYGSITIVERDVLPEAPIQRRGVSQGRHLHALLTRGSSVLAELFPGLFDELVASGANVIDGTDPSQICIQIGGHQLSRTGKFADPEALVTHLASRPLLEAHVRRRVRAIPNVAFLEHHDVVEPILGHAERVTAARVVDRTSSEERELDADLVVDAAGRSARTPAFLEKHGYEGPPEQKYAVDLNYSSQFFRVPDGLLAEKMVLVGPTIERPTGAGILAYENGTVILTLIGIAGRRLPTDLPAVIAFAADLLPARITAALRAAEPLGDVHARHYPTSLWRRYDKLNRFPKGLVVIGDAVCSFNPVYGQGMTSSALQARALRDCLADAETDDLSQRYFRSAAKKLAPIWQANRLNDFAVSPVHDWRSLPQRLLNWHTDKVMAAAANDMVLTETFIRTLGLIDRPSRLLRPSMLLRVVRGNRRRTNRFMLRGGISAFQRWQYRGGRPQWSARATNRLAARFIAAGIGPHRAATLEVRGHKSGRTISFPVVVVDYQGERYLVAMLGHKTNWVRNLRAGDGRAVLRRGRREEVGLLEDFSDGRAEILRRYLELAPGARPFFAIDRHASVADFERIADQYPVFRVV